MPAQIPTLEEIRAAFREELARLQPPAQEAGMHLVKATDYEEATGITQRVLDKLVDAGRLRYYRAGERGQKYVNPAEVAEAMRSGDK